MANKLGITPLTFSEFKKTKGFPVSWENSDQEEAYKSYRHRFDEKVDVCPVLASDSGRMISEMKANFPGLAKGFSVIAHQVTVKRSLDTLGISAFKFCDYNISTVDRKEEDPIKAIVVDIFVQRYYKEMGVIDEDFTLKDGWVDHVVQAVEAAINAEDTRDFKLLYNILSKRLKPV